MCLERIVYFEQNSTFALIHAHIHARCINHELCDITVLCNLKLNISLQNNYCNVSVFSIPSFQLRIKGSQLNYSTGGPALAMLTKTLKHARLITLKDTEYART